MNAKQAHTVRAVDHNTPLGCLSSNVMQRLHDKSDVIDLIESFAYLLPDRVKLDGLIYENDALHIHIQQGDTPYYELIFPLSLYDEALGQISIYRDSVFQANEIRSLEEMLASLLMPLQTVLHRTLAKRLQNTEHLLQHIIEREVALAVKHHRFLSVLRIQSTGFSKPDHNDALLWDLSDQLIVDAIRKILTKKDLIYKESLARYLVILHDKDFDEATVVADNLQSNIRQMQVYRANKVLQLTTEVALVSLEDYDDAHTILNKLNQLTTE